MKDEAQRSDKTAMLMLRLSGELSDSDNAKLDQMLLEDAQLRQELEAMRQAMDAGFGALASLDEGEHPMPEGVAQRRAARMMRQWAIERLVPRPASSVLRAPIPWIRYSLAVAALVLVSFTVWGVYHPGRRASMRMASVPLSNADRENLMVATLGVGDLEDLDEIQASVPPRLEDMDFVSDISSHPNVNVQ